jgi:site-specific DNA-methyltransferase (adenine-specific)
VTTGLLKGNCLEQLLLIPDNSVDSVVTDPPYELGFMGKGWDASGIAYNVAVWEQCFRVLKPGGHLLAFGGTRTYHRIAVAIEDAGFEVRDSIHWTYGSGFPKSMNISKAIDKQAGAKREIIGYSKGVVVEDNQGYGGIARGGVGVGQKSADIPVTAPSTPDAQKWDGWGTALKPSHEPVIVARKPVIGTVANNVLTYGTGALNIDGSRVGSEGGTMDVPTGLGLKSGHVYNPTLGHSTETKLEGLGRWPANTILTHSPDCLSTNDVWHCVEGCPVLNFPQTASTGNGTTTGFRKGGNNEHSVGLAGKKQAADGYADGGSAARYFTQTAYDEIDFPPFIYQAKASSRERSEGLGDLETKQTVGGGGLTNVGDKYGSIKAPAKNFHPTVKPVSLMRHLVRLVTPQGGLVLDPFLGSGTTAVAALLENCQWVGCELTEDYWSIIEGRIAWATDKAGKNDTLF